MQGIENPNQKQDAAQTLSNLSQNPFPSQAGIPVPYPPGAPGINDPGPSSHPRGPPNLGQLSAVAMQQQPAQPRPPTEGSEAPVSSAAPVSTQDAAGSPSADSSANGATGGSASATTSRRGRNPAIGSEEWQRQRKDNHKEVERRRRGNINEGINELGRIVPNGTGEKAKGAILARAVQYIHHLKENEARNIEKWTLEKLLMDQAMGDLQTQLEEVKKLWDEERQMRIRLERELELVRGQGVVKEDATAAKRRSEDGAQAAVDDADRDGKRQRTD
ncbi:hypothetical protein FA13DRAFT_110575 [Coprinellus micaceus]|uniref:BHLH domain-containing protein n=1 Tax=Coprinellus micaceus TaxID=71717 RepID=A0A4Y7TIF7_COPMI|nr:hypothetical protein FA13DRAFT_110575 [Coprinellus micaceus]